MPTIYVDDEVWKSLQRQAEPFVDNPNAVLRKILGLKKNSHGADGPVQRHVGGRRDLGRATGGSIFPQAGYEQPILEFLIESGGESRRLDVVQGVFRKVRSRLTPQDLESIPSGSDIRWRRGVLWQKQRMVDDGLIERPEPRGTAPRGIWRLTPAGRRAAKSERSRNAG